MVEKRNGERNRDHKSKRCDGPSLTRLPLIYPRIFSGQSVDPEG